MDLDILLHLLKKRFVKPHIAKRISLAEVCESQISLEQEGESPRGQIVCLPWKKNATLKAGKSSEDIEVDCSGRHDYY